MGTRDEYVKNIKSVFVGLGVKGLMTFLIAEVPFLAAPIPRYILEHVLSYILGKLADLAEMQIFFLYIDFRTSKQGQDFMDAVKKNEETKKNGTPEEKARAEKALIDRFREFAKLTN